MGEPAPISSIDRTTAHSLEEEIRSLEGRLRKGEEILRSRKAAGEDAEVLHRYEMAWVKLLRQYEILCDRLQRQSAHQRETQNVVV